MWALTGKFAQDQWTSRAELAVKAGEDDLAREALKKRKGFEEQLKTWNSQLKQQEQAVEQLLANTRQMEAKLAEAKSKKETLKARAASAKSSKQARSCCFHICCSAAESPTTAALRVSR
jgi:phage shock protein A